MPCQTQRASRFSKSGCLFLFNFIIDYSRPASPFQLKGNIVCRPQTFIKLQGVVYRLKWRLIHAGNDIPVSQTHSQKNGSGSNPCQQEPIRFSIRVMGADVDLGHQFIDIFQGIFDLRPTQGDSLGSNFS
jgi:hypothetical protein